MQGNYHASDYTTAGPIDTSDAGRAALSTGAMIVTAAVFLTVLRKSGFKAMVAVGRG